MVTNQSFPFFHRLKFNNFLFQKVLASSKHVEKVYFYKLLHTFLGEGLVTSKGIQHMKSSSLYGQVQVYQTDNQIAVFINFFFAICLSRDLLVWQDCKKKCNKFPCLTSLILTKFIKINYNNFLVSLVRLSAKLNFRFQMEKSPKINSTLFSHQQFGKLRSNF